MNRRGVGGAAVEIFWLVLLIVTLMVFSMLLFFFGSNLHRDTVASGVYWEADWAAVTMAQWPLDIEVAPGEIKAQPLWKYVQDTEDPDEDFIEEQLEPFAKLYVHLDGSDEPDRGITYLIAREDRYVAPHRGLWERLQRDEFINPATGKRRSAPEMIEDGVVASLVEQLEEDVDNLGVVVIPGEPQVVIIVMSKELEE